MFSDGKKPARQQQIEIAEWIDVNIKKFDVLGLNLPPGYGKSYLARGLQRGIGNTDIITASNVLVDQYHRDYPELNVVKGRTHYDTEEEYQLAKSLARDSKDSIFNPLSALFTRMGLGSPLRCIIVDEAHTLADMLRTAASTSFNTKKSGIPPGLTSEFELATWARSRFKALEAQFLKGNSTSASRDEMERIGAIYYSIAGHELDSVFKIRRSSRTVNGRLTQNLVVDAVDCPTPLLAQVLRAEKIILMSGTLTKDETARLAHGRKWTWTSRPYLAPKMNRPVYIDTVAQEQRRDVHELAKKVRKIYAEAGSRPTLVHVSYGDSLQYAKELHDLNPLVNTNTNKYATEQEFRKRGGLWIASGCAEGIDLADSACRVVIIPSLLFPNKGDMHVQKRLGLPGGNQWYALKTLENTVQRLGRGLRSADDYCDSYICDPAFPRLWQQYKDQFEELNICWGLK